MYKQNYTISSINYPNLDKYIIQIIENFCQSYKVDNNNLLAVSISVVGKIDNEKDAIIQLGNHHIHCSLTSNIQTFFNCPVLLSEHFKLWLLAESTVGSLISNSNVIFLQLDDTVNLSVLLNGALLHKQSKMNIDNMLMPKFSSFSDEIFLN